MSLNTLFHLSCMLVAVCTAAVYYYYSITLAASEKRAREVPNIPRDAIMHLVSGRGALAIVSAIFCVGFTVLGLALGPSASKLIWGGRAGRVDALLRICPADLPARHPRLRALHRVHFYYPLIASALQPRFRDQEKQKPR
jgi:hypothetical protein